MDKARLTLLGSDVKAQMDVIETIYDKLDIRTAELQPDDEIQLESAAYQLHNLYNAVEDLFQLVATHFENQIAGAGRWHTELLRRMNQDVEGVRPALLSNESYVLLNGLRSFRHFFRHAYAAPLEYAHLQINLDKARQLRPYLERDVVQFLRRFQG